MVQGINFDSSKVIVGVTGSFGSGKSTVTHLLEELGAFRVDADHLAHEALLHGNPVYQKVAEIFGGAKDEKGNLDRHKIAEIVFSDGEKRQQLEDIVHPYVFQRIVEEVADSEEKVAALEIPLLFETGFHEFCNFSIVVKTDEERLFDRLKEKGFDQATVRARLKLQMPMSEKEQKADFVINNSDGLEGTKKQVLSIWKKLDTVSKGAQ